MPTKKGDWILLALREAPMDRIHLMKVLFLLWHRAGRNIHDYFQFEPYLYGPCSFEIYSILTDLSAQGLVVQAPHPVQNWANYYLTNRGREMADEAAKVADATLFGLLRNITKEIATMGFENMLRMVYSEAPEFATRSLVGGLLKT